MQLVCHEALIAHPSDFFTSHGEHTPALSCEHRRHCSGPSAKLVFSLCVEVVKKLADTVHKMKQEVAKIEVSSIRSSNRLSPGKGREQAVTRKELLVEASHEQDTFSRSTSVAQTN